MEIHYKYILMEQLMDSRVLRGWYMAPHYSQAGHLPSLHDFHNQTSSISIEEKIHLNFSPCFPPKVASD